MVGPSDAPLTVVLLHGFGAPGDDLVALADHLDAPARCVFPAAPLELGGMYGSARAWWLLDLARLENQLRRGVPTDLRAEVPEGLPAVRAQLLRFLDELQARHAIPDDRLVLGGFSQGAMLSLDVALHRDRPLAGLVLLSATLVAEAEWKPRMARLADLPIMMSHGRADQLLPFAVSDALRGQLEAAGARVAWHPFRGGHEIPSEVLEAAGSFLRDRATVS